MEKHTLGKIAKTTFDAVDKSIADIIHDVDISYWKDNTIWDDAKGDYKSGAKVTLTCRGLEITTSAKTDKSFNPFGDFVWTESDRAFMLSDFDKTESGWGVLKNGWWITLSGSSYVIVATLDLMIAGEIFMVIGRKE